MGADVVAAVLVVLVRKAGLGVGGVGAGTDICCEVAGAGILPLLSDDEESKDGDGGCDDADVDTRMLSTPASSWAASCA